MADGWLTHSAIGRGGISLYVSKSCPISGRLADTSDAFFATTAPARTRRSQGRNFLQSGRARADANGRGLISGGTNGGRLGGAGMRRGGGGRSGLSTLYSAADGFAAAARNSARMRASHGATLAFEIPAWRASPAQLPDARDVGWDNRSVSVRCHWSAARARAAHGWNKELQ